MATVLDDDGLWERYIYGTGWTRCYSDDAIEAAFQLGRDNISLTLSSTREFVTITFATMTLQVRGATEPLRRLTTKDQADIIYEWEDQYSGAMSGSIWTPYSTDDCEMFRIAEEAGRSKVAITLASSYPHISHARIC
jgi:hypothetical protein